MKNKKLVATLDHLRTLETDLENAYQLLGKQTQEFTVKKSIPINKLVDEIIRTKETIQALENNRS